MHFIAVLLFALSADELQQSRTLQQEARAALQAQQHGLFLQKIRAASELRPSHPTLLYQLAAALTLNGKHHEALDVLERVAAMGMVYAPGKQADFAALHALPRFAAIAARFVRNAAPIGTAAKAIELRRKGMIAEGLAYDAEAKRFFVGSVRNREILAVDAKGKVTTFARELPGGAFGLTVDAKRDVLWATVSVIGQSDKTALLKLDLRTGRVLATIGAPRPAAAPPSAFEGGTARSEAHLFGDVIVTRRGEVLVSDSSAPAIYRLKDDKTFETVVAGAPLTNVQGLAVLGEKLYVSDYSKGLFVLELHRRGRAAAPALVPVLPDVTLLGVDGLYALGKDTLIATQNGTSPSRILRIRLANGRVAEVTTLAANLPRMLDPTLGVIAEGRFWFNANAQWDQFGDDGKPRDESKLEEAVILGIDL